MDYSSSIKAIEEEILDFVLEHPGTKLFGDTYQFLNERFVPTTNNLQKAFDNLIETKQIEQRDEVWEFIVIGGIFNSPVECLKQANIYPNLNLNMLWKRHIKKKSNK